jgi:excisionase family DNA binding protein
MNPKLYSAPEVASMLGIKVDTLYRYARNGKLRALKIGKLWRFAMADIEEFTPSHRYLASPVCSKPMLLPEILRDTARKFEQRIAVICGASQRSYAEIDLLSDRFAHALLEKGIEPGDRVVVILANSVEFVIACFGIWKARAIVVAEDGAIRPNSFMHVLEETQPTALVVDRNVAVQLEGMQDPLRNLRAILVKDQTFAISPRANIHVESLEAVLEFGTRSAAVCLDGARADDVVSISYTSGSTGTPKGVTHTHQSWLAAAEFTRDYLQLSARDKILIPLPLHHAYAFRQILAYLSAGGTVEITADIFQALRLLRQQRPTALLLVPAACNIIIDHFPSILQEADCFLRYTEVGAAPLVPQRLQQLRKLLPSTPIHVPYGLTEARVGFLKAGPDGLLNQISKVSPGLEVRVVDIKGHPVQTGQTGEIVLKGRGLMKGYWNKPPAEQDGLHDAWFHSGDMGRLTNLGEIALLGRIDDVIKVGGRKVNPLEVEAILNNHSGVVESAVARLPDPQGILEQELHAFVVLKKDAAASESELLAHCRQHLEPYKIPARIHVRLSLPKSSVGKLQRHLLASEQAATTNLSKEASYASSD